MIDIKIQTNVVPGEDTEYRIYLTQPSSYIEICIAKSDNKEELIQELKNIISDLNQVVQEL